MAERTTIPILMDGDTGFGNYNNARRLVRKLEERGVAGVCFEDKVFQNVIPWETENKNLPTFKSLSIRLRYFSSMTYRRVKITKETQTFRLWLDVSHS